MKSRRRSCVRSTASAEEKKSKHFMKAILPSPIHQNQIRIPDEFIRRFGNELSNVATITVPDGSIWKFTLNKCGKDVFFSNNWQQFTQYYDIGYGSYLSFKYKGNSKFSVIIFDATSVEICYPSTNEEPNIKSPSPNPGPKKRSKVDTTEKNHETKFIYASKRAKDAANQFYPKNPFFRSTLNKNRYTYVASNFAEKYLLPKVPIKLQNSHGQQWEVSCVFNMGRTFGMRITGGFCKFQRDNNLSLGDTCVYELIKTKPVVVLLVTEFRADNYLH